MSRTRAGEPTAPKAPKTSKAPKASKAGSTKKIAPKKGASPAKKAAPKKASSRSSAAPVDGTYLYCLVRAADEPRPADGLLGLPGMDSPRILDAGGGLYLWASTAPLELYGKAPIEEGLSNLAWVSERALAHEAVVEAAARQGTVVPMKLFTLFASDARALGHIRRERAKIERALDRVEGREEWGVRLKLDEPRARSAVKAKRAPAKASSGAAFLLAKKKDREASRDLLDQAIVEADRAFDELASRADGARRRRASQAEIGARVLLDAAFLVPQAQVASFREAAERLATRLSEGGFDVSLTGPWPPYNFIAEEP